MRYSLLAATLLFISGVVSTLVERDQDDVNGRSQPRICRSLHVKGGGCVRYVRGFDITGVTTEIDLRFPQIKDECACIKACLDSKGTCNNYVYKFTDAASVESGYRACTLYSNFVLPPNVTIEFDVNSAMNVNIQPLSAMNNPQAGGLAPEAFKDKNLNTTFDEHAVSGPLWSLADGSVVC